jgi:hypothetical protein
MKLGIEVLFSFLELSIELLVPLSFLQMHLDFLLNCMGLGLLLIDLMIMTFFMHVFIFYFIFIRGLWL